MLQGSSFNQSIVDINECLDDNGGCEQTCNDTEGGFMCGCDEGFVLNANKINCQGKYPPNVEEIELRHFLKIPLQNVEEKKSRSF